MVPLEVMPVAAAIAPVLFTWNASPVPTVKSAAGEVSPIPTFPAVSIVKRSFVPSALNFAILNEPLAAPSSPIAHSYDEVLKLTRL